MYLTIGSVAVKTWQVSRTNTDDNCVLDRQSERLFRHSFLKKEEWQELNVWKEERSVRKMVKFEIEKEKICPKVSPGLCCTSYGYYIDVLKGLGFCGDSQFRDQILCISKLRN